MAQTGQRTAQAGVLRPRKAPAWVAAAKGLRTFARKKPLAGVALKPHVPQPASSH